MTRWPSTKASMVYRALLRVGWVVEKRRSGSHIQLRHPDYLQPFTWAFHDGDEIGPVMLARIAKKTGLKTDDL